MDKIGNEINYCKIVIPDTGPLISLHRGHVLWLLEKLDTDIVVTNAVKYEFEAFFIENKSREMQEEADEIRSRLDDFHATYINTPSSQKVENVIRKILILNSEERSKHVADEIKSLRRSIKHAGENSILEAIDILDDLDRVSPSQIALVLFEDKRIPKLRGYASGCFSEMPYSRKIQLLGTRAFLHSMERAGVIKDISFVFKAMERLQKGK
jgi:hypothetical protein